MDNILDIDIKLKELRKKIKVLRHELLKLIQEWDYLQNILYEKLITIYDCLFGEIETEIEEKTKLSSQLERKIELINQNRRNGEKVGKHTIGFINRIISKEFEIRNSQYHNNGVKQYNTLSNDGDELPHVYRNLVKLLHPDISNKNEEFQKFWYNIQDAYKDGNLHRLKLLHQILTTDIIKKYPNKYTEELALRNEIRRLEMNILAEKRNIHRLKLQEPYIWENKLNNNIWILQKRKLLEDEIKKLDKKIEINQRRFRLLVSFEEESLIEMKPDYLLDTV